MALPDWEEPITAAQHDREGRLSTIHALAGRAMPHSSKHGQDFLEWIKEICEGMDPDAIYEAARADYEDPEEENWDGPRELT